MTCRATITYDEAIAILREEAQPLGIETVLLSKAGRRVLAEPICARLDAPRHDAAAMDGFAIQSARGDEAIYQLLGASYPGQPWSGRLAAGQAIRIMTGAVVPEGADRVVPIELAEESTDNVCFPRGWPAKHHIRRRGSDLQAGQLVLAPGTVLDPRSLLVAAAADVSAVRAWKRPFVSIIASGDELAAPGTAAEREGAIPDTLSEAIMLLARQFGAKPSSATLVPDDSDAISVVAASALPNCDVLVLIGGASRGDRDFAKAGLEPLGLEICLADVAMKPGKPIWYGRVGGKHVLGLPGNPTAAMTTARLFLAPLLQALGGGNFDDALNWRMLPLSGEVAPGGTRESFLCGTVNDGCVEIIEHQSASAQLMLTRADVLVRVPQNEPARAAGEHADALKF